MTEFEKGYEQAVQSGLLPGAVLLATSRDGTFNYCKSFGSTSTVPEQKRNISEKDVFSIASFTKLPTSIAVMQCVEKGLLNLDSDVESIIPEVNKYGIISAWDEAKDQPVFAAKQGKITLRHLISGQSGHCYEAVHPLLNRWRTSRSETTYFGATVEEKCTIPLAFEPGTAWAYGGGWDWAGKIVERVTHQTLEDYMQENIWKPLQLHDCTFWPNKRPDFENRRVDISFLDQEKQKAVQGEFDATMGATDCCGGGGLYATPADYLQFLSAVLSRDEKLLKQSTFAELCSPQLDQTVAAIFNGIFKQFPEAQNFYGCAIPPETKKNYSLGGLYVDEDVPNWMCKGTMLWSGLPCLVWFVDHQTGLCGLAASQVLPAMAPEILALHKGFQRGIYDLFKAHTDTKSK